MTTIYLATGNALAELTTADDRCEVALHLTDRAVQCFAINALKPRHLYCGTFGQGLWYSHNGGRDWQRAGAGFTQRQITSVTVSVNERIADCGVVYAGAEPSAVFRSEDAGDSWQKQTGLNVLPSASEWSFPPRPETHHVRWIQPDRFIPSRLYVAIEAGALIRSNNGGRNWHDRTATAPIDTHQMAMHRLAPGRVYSAAGDGYFESHDGGEVWQRIEDGLDHRYVWSVAVDSADAENRIISAAAGPRQSHDRDHAESYLYRRTAISS